MRPRSPLERRPSRLRAAVILTLSLSLFLNAGCATILDGRTQKVHVNSIPKGALVTRGGVVLGETPDTVELARFNSRPLVIEKDGHRRVMVRMDQTLNLTTLWNGLLFLFGVVPGVVGFAVDAVTGSMVDLHPRRVSVHLPLLRGAARLRDNLPPVTAPKSSKTKR